MGRLNNSKAVVAQTSNFDHGHNFRAFVTELLKAEPELNVPDTSEESMAGRVRRSHEQILVRFIPPFHFCPLLLLSP